MNLEMTIKEANKLIKLTELETIDIQLEELRRHRPYLQQDFFKRRLLTLEQKLAKLKREH